MTARTEYFDAAGRQLSEAEAKHNGTVRDGVRVRTHVRFVDGVPAIFDTNDAARIFATSVAGQRAIALARRAHDLAQGYKGAAALPFSDADAAAVVRRELGVVDTIETLTAARDAAKAARTERLANGWRS